MMRCLLLLILLTRLVLAPGGWADEPANQASPTAEEAAVLDQPEPADTPAAERNGMADLDEATTLKVTAEGAANINQINQVIDLLDSALEKGLDPDNTDFAQQMLVSTLVQRAQILSAAILSRPIPNPRQDPRWIQVRSFALTDLGRAIELGGNPWEAHLLVGRLQSLPLGDRRAARRAFTKVIEADDVPPFKQAEAYALRGATFREDTDKQLHDYTRAIELDANKPEYLRLRAQTLYQNEQLEEALADIDRGLELDDEHAATHEMRGMVLLGLERFDEAKTSFDRASELAPEALLPYQHRSEMYRRQGDLQKAIEQLTKALELKPDDLATLLIRAGVHYQAGDADAALADVETVIDESPGFLVKAHQMKAEILIGEGRTNEAITHLETQIAKAPDRPELLEMHYQLATYLLVDSQAEKAIDAFGKVLEWDENNPDALRGRGDAYLNLGRHADAIADFDRAVAVDDEDPGLLNNFAWVLATSPDDERRDGARALELATKACELTAYQTPHILSTLAAAHAELGEFQEAIKWSTEAVDLADDDDPNKEQLAKELESYEAGKPWRELHPTAHDQESESESPPVDEEPATEASSAPPAPARTADF